MNMAYAGVLRQVCTLLLIACLGSPLTAQNLPTRPPSTSGGSSSVNLDFKFDETLGTTFYVDMLGLEAAKLPFSPEVRIDPSRYIVGPNDLMGVIITGTFSLNYRAMGVNAEGDLYLPSIGAVQVAGMSLLDARAAIKGAVEKQYRNVMVDVMLDKPRPLTIHVYGDIPYPGRISVPYGTRLDVPLSGALIKMTEMPTSAVGQSSLTRQLFPSFLDIPGMSPTNLNDAESNSGVLALIDLVRERKYQFRSIQVQRANGDVFYADLFDYYWGGNLEANPILYDGDQIFVTTSRESDTRISISGAVHYPIELPYRSDDTIERLLKIAGGFTANADITELKLYRSVGMNVTQTSMQLNDATKKALLMPNDRLVVSALTLEKSNFSASVTGHVVTPGIYPIREDVTTAWDVLNIAGGLSADGLGRAAYIVRSKSPVANQPELARASTRELMRGSDQMVQGLSWLELEQRINKNRIYLDASNETQLRAIKIIDGDSLIVPRDMKAVYVFGQVNLPGYVEHKPSATISHYLASTGGFTKSSDPKRVYVIKAGSLAWADAYNSTIESGDMIYVDRVLLDDNLQKRNFLVQRQTFFATLVLTISSTTFAILNYLRN
jgi:polysaccharide biosynthesis/export protein